MYHNQGKVIIMGAGPGDPELITLKAARWLGCAEVVLTDRLVSEEILRTHVSASAEIIYVGKQCSKAASTPQQTINALMIKYAQQGKLVVRLKGGDVSIFSNILDELKTLSDHKIAYEIVPGVTAALGAAAYAGIPLTARGYATAVRFLTYYKSDVLSDAYWRELAATEDTLVFYMSAETLPLVMEKLNENGAGADKLVAVVEEATTPAQKISVCSLYDESKAFSEKKWASPSLVIIGRVVALYQQFNWFETDSEVQGYFPPVAAKLFECEETEIEKLLTA
ncbi:MAG: uroporphyrinogen-III C-methyltransferase [Flavisolibacter sp.]